mgnify:CR=1 FL=1
MSLWIARMLLGLWMLTRGVGASEGLQTALDEMTGSLGNLTPPEAQLGQRRGVLSGGSMVIRNRITQSQPIHLSPPSFQAGCGGIDLYGGSFSFINQPQFTALLRAIASNAGGYAFQLGINAMCPDCGNLMSDLQRKMQSLNELFSNSCQMAQGIVQDSVSAFDAQSRSRLSTLSVSRGLGDVFQGFTGSSGDPVGRLAGSDPEGYLGIVGGNIGWRFLRKAGDSGWYQFAGTPFLESVMSLTGSLIVQAPKIAPDGLGKSTPITRLPPLIGLRELIHGTEVNATRPTSRVYRCDSDGAEGCLAPVMVDLVDPGLAGRLRKLMAGDAPGDGLIGKFGTGSGQFTEAELAFMALAPESVGALIRNLSREDPGLAAVFAERAAAVLALEMAMNLVEDLTRSLQETSSLSDFPHAELYRKELRNVIDARHAEKDLLSKRYGNLDDLTRHYETLLASGRGRDYGVEGPLPEGPGFLKH